MSSILKATQVVLVLTATVASVVAGLAPGTVEKFDHASNIWLSTIQDHPFSAQLNVDSQLSIEKTRRPTREFKIYRDSNGRTLSVPARANIALQRFSEIDDPVTGYWYIVDSDNKIIHRSKLTVRPAAAGSRFVSGPNTTSLGSQYLLGVQVTGLRTTLASQGSMVEQWLSPELQLMMIQRTSNTVGTGSDTVTALQIGEPSAQLFQLPADYTIVDEVGSFIVK